MAINLTHSSDTISPSTESLHIDATGAMTIPVGTTAQRPGAPNVGDMRFNTDDASPETWDGTSWVQNSESLSIIYSLIYAN